MPRAVTPEIFLIAKTVADRDAMRLWLRHLGVSEEYTLPPGEQVTDASLVVGVAAKGCYNSFEVSEKLNPNLTKIRTDWGAYLDNVLASGHGAVTEHVTFTFAISNVSRVFSAEMNRHRAGWAISERSLRYCRFGEEIPYVQPPCTDSADVAEPERVRLAVHAMVRRAAESESPPAALAASMQHALTVYNLADVLQKQPLAMKQQMTREVFQAAFRDDECWYRVLETIWADELAPTSTFADKKAVTSMLRRIVGLGVATGGVWTGNVRALRHVLTLRCAPAAEEEILYVFSRVAKAMKDSEPMLFGDFTQTDDGYWVPKYIKV